MFAMLQIPTGVIIAIYAVVIGVPVGLNLIAAAVGARGAGSSGRRFKAMGCGLGAGIVVTLLMGWVLLGLGAAVLSAPLIGAGVSFAVGRGVANPPQAF
jgi:hypothetical protein